ncbi:hypothetical protein GGTG_04971 [Gaeumannomyces tritici R3-111a-1]|uniref:F-box domain-containing protein n=1 Tax=Gaeumannomyces tritici (strain R3-111a-1) TaxID=644352 RepID=J3NUL6_GAET3|nr:hypothetical protein GGTG_04971 [Gaeumannomyces tritici R3-111a-1]EJT79889.1 hypothetical protein GGTG_04971 [Gaeumannomyces tritici R3-111a-1]
MHSLISSRPSISYKSPPPMDQPHQLSASLVARIPVPSFYPPTQPFSQPYQTMAVASHRARRGQSVHVYSLAAEILALIFRHVRNYSLVDIVVVRLVCRRFNEIAIPIQYQTLVLTKRLLYHPSPGRLMVAYANMHLYTNHVIASIDDQEDCAQNHRAVARITENIMKLSTFTWRYSRTGPSLPCTCPIGSLFLRAPGGRGALRRETKVHIEGLSPRCIEQHQSALLDGIPTELLASLDMAYPSPPLQGGVNGLKQMLLGSRSIKTFQYRDRGQGTSFELSGTDRLPSFEKLYMECYDWVHSKEEVARHWDFTRLRSLQLIDMPILRTLRSLDPRDLWGLRTLVLRDSGISDGREELSWLLDTIVRSHVGALQRLELTVETQSFRMDALFCHARTLRHLSLRDFVGFSDDTRRCPTLWVGDLERLASELVELRTLELDMDTARTDPPLFLRALCMFPKLHTLTIHVHTVVHPFEELPQRIDKDREAAMQLFSFLTSERAKAMGLAGGTGEPPSWRRITLNVGGWKPVMVRRLSRSWKAQNRRGIFAERCFVMHQRQCASPLSPEPYEISEVACDELGRDHLDPQDDPDVNEELSGIAHRMGQFQDPDEAPEFSYADFTEAVLEYIHRGTIPPGNIFASQAADFGDGTW